MSSAHLNKEIEMTTIGGTNLSISHAGMAIFDQPIRSTIGGIVVDLASAPITPGEHRLEIEAGVGGIEIYLPRYVQFTVEGGPTIGGQDVHDGLGVWEKMTNKLRSALHLPSTIPDHAVENPNPDAPVKIHFVIDGVAGGLDIYRL
jgi:hypothetical protein